MELFFSLDYVNFTHVLFEFLALFGISAFLIWMVAVIILQFTKKNIINREFIIFRTFLISISICAIFFSIYLLFFVKLTGYENYNWNYFSFRSDSIYILLLPQIILLLSIIISFIIVFNSTTKILNK